MARLGPSLGKERLAQDEIACWRDRAGMFIPPDQLQSLAEPFSLACRPLGLNSTRPSIPETTAGP